MNNTLKFPALLSSKAIRDQLSHRTESEFEGAAGVIDDMRAKFEALRVLHATPDPAMTKEARALRYAKQLESTRKYVLKAATNAVDHLTTLEEKICAAATSKAGLDKRLPPHEEAEVRAALRQMSDKERTRAITQAAERGDVYLLNAVRFAPSAVTIGPHTAAVDALFEMLLDSAAPTLKGDLADIETAVNHVTLAAGAFGKHSEALRDPILEARGEENNAALREAEKALQ